MNKLKVNMKKKWIIVSILIATIFIAAALTKPTDKKIKINVIEAIWRDRVPNKYGKPDFYEQFMNITTQAIIIDDWLFIKRIRYLIGNDKKIIGYAAFGKIVFTK
jgi:hypothetical protein